ADLRRASALVDHGQLERQPLHLSGAADPFEEREVLGEAAERDVLAVVGWWLRIAFTLGQRLHLAAERRPCLVKGHFVAAVHELPRGSGPGQAAPDYRGPHRASAAPTTRSFATGESVGAPPKTSNPSASIRSSVEL